MQRELQRLIPGYPTSDGAGVNIRRTLGQNRQATLDPFLMLDEFGSSDAQDYIAGFPSHPHRGFETVTYMLDGHMLHEDHLGNRGDLKSGGVQWMTAGRGIIHSEMPQQEEGLMRGFQLWVNLPAAEKMKPAGYKDIAAESIPVLVSDKVQVKVIAGDALLEGQHAQGPMAGLSTELYYLDIRLNAHASFEQQIPADHNAFIYVYEGRVKIGDLTRELTAGNVGVLSKGDSIAIKSFDQDAKVILLAGKPINEPVVQYGPFVMNTSEEIEQAINDYRAGTLAQ